MQTIEDHIIVRATPENVFDLSQDYNLRLEWDPFIRDIKFLNGATKVNVGVQVWVRAWTGLTMTVEYITLKRPNVVAMKMLSGPKFFCSFSGSWRFEPHSTFDTEVTFKYAFDIRWKSLAWLLNPIIKLVFHRDIIGRLKGLKHGVEQKKLITKLNSKAVV
ncbi:MAG: SRPBCC family protein [Blastocatellia bacterium]